MFASLVDKWWVVALRGVAAILFGIAALVWPGMTLAVLVMLFGAYAIADGFFALFSAIGSDGKDRLWYVLAGIIGIGLGILVFAYPGITGLALVYLIGIWAILTGVLEIAAGFELPMERDWLLAVSGLLSVVFGVYVLFNPGTGAVAIVWTIGGYAVLFGIVLCVLAFRLRGLKK
jgi:uncharacterized membrane protein HdeD (DUF308 family)